MILFLYHLMVLFLHYFFLYCPLSFSFTKKEKLIFFDFKALFLRIFIIVKREVNRVKYFVFLYFATNRKIIHTKKTKSLSNLSNSFCFSFPKYSKQ